MDWMPPDPTVLGLVLTAARHNQTPPPPPPPPDDNQALEVHSPFGWWGKVTGNSTLIIVNLAVVALVFWRLDSHERHEREEWTLVVETLRMDAHKRQIEILDNQVKILSAALESQRENKLQTYIMTLSEKEKSELQLAVPEELIARRQQGRDRFRQ